MGHAAFMYKGERVHVTRMKAFTVTEQNLPFVLLVLFEKILGTLHALLNHWRFAELINHTGCHFRNLQSAANSKKF